MSDRVSQTIILCEDEEHERLTRAYLKRCDLTTRSPYVKPLVASREQQGGNDAWVLNRFPKELHACRQRQKHKAKTLLIVLIDADNYSVEDRRRQLFERAKSAGLEQCTENDPVALLIPKRHIETWIRALLGENVTEEQDCKKWHSPTRDEIRQAVEKLYEWSRLNAIPSSTCCPSLAAALAEWRKIG